MFSTTGSPASSDLFDVDTFPRTGDEVIQQASMDWEATQGRVDNEADDGTYEEKKRATEEALARMREEWEPVHRQALQSGVNPAAVFGQKRPRSPSPERSSSPSYTENSSPPSSPARVSSPAVSQTVFESPRSPSKEPASPATSSVALKTPQPEVSSSPTTDASPATPSRPTKPLRLRKNPNGSVRSTPAPQTQPEASGSRLPPAPSPSSAKADRKGKGTAIDDDAPPAKRARTSVPPQASNSGLPATPAPAPPSPKGNSKGKGKAVATPTTPAAPTPPAAPAKTRTFIARENINFTCGWNGCKAQVSSKAWEAHMGAVHGVQKNDGWTALEREERKCMHEDCVAARAAGKTSKDKMNSWASVLRHYRTKHQQPKLYKCAVCAKAFDRRDALSRHTRDEKCKPRAGAAEGKENARPAPAVAGSSSSAAAAVKAEDVEESVDDSEDDDMEPEEEEGADAMDSVCLKREIDEDYDGE
ncbi:hypothetical protein FKP32DRAFT_412226 [Trametes sanguinea]|nr:hypothetical protein FKP32DRAFT_412226 [Trametes sanguinea]